MTSRQWMGTWTTTPAMVDGQTVTNQTLRMIARFSVGGQSVRVRLSNALGTRDLMVGPASVALRDNGAAVLAGTARALTLNGQTSITIPAGALVMSDPVAIDVPALADVAISVYVPGDIPADPLTGHQSAHQTGYVSSPGDFTHAAELPVDHVTESFLLVTGVEVEVPGPAGTIVAFGDSLTEGNISTLDANHRWPDQLARRLAARTQGRMFGVVNQGIGGNRLLHDGGIPADSGVRRFDRDVLAQPGASHVIVLLGVNDLRNSPGKTEEIVTADALIAGLHQLAVRGRDAGLVMIGETIMPFEGDTFRGGFYTAEGEVKRKAVNAWIRGTGAFDGVIDFDAAVCDPDLPSRLAPRWNSGDHLHPSDSGYLHMGDIVDLSLFGA